jgi:outer membrane receptor protein involved in Fe transport
VADAWEIGFRWAYGSWTLQTAGFYRYGRNVYHTVNELTVGGFALEWFPYVNFRAERIRGLETQVRFESRSVPVGLILNYTLAWHDFYGPVTGGFMARSEENPFETGKFPAPMDQRHTVTGIVTAAPRPWLRASLSGTWASGLPAEHGHAETGMPDEHSPAAHRMPSYLYLNGQVAVRLRSRPDVWLNLSGENLTNRRTPITTATAFNPAQYLPKRKVLLTLRAAW